MEKLVSIIILNYNNYLYTINCLKSLTNQSYKNFEVIVLDNGSEYNLYLKLKEELEQFEKVLNLKLIRSDLNLYFTGGNNKVIKMVKGEYICLLNYDTIVQSDFIEKMVDFLEKTPDASMITPKVKIYKNENYLWYAGGKINFRSLHVTNIRGYLEYDPKNQKYNEIINTDYAIGTALFFKKKIIDEIGLMDDIFLMYHEEVDWNLRAKERGYKSYYVPTTIVYHDVSYIINKRKSFIINYFLKRNYQIFVWKHAKFRDVIIFYCNFFLWNLKDIKFYLFAILKKKIYLVFIQLYPLWQGFRIGIKRRTNRSCRKYLIKDYNFITRAQKIIQLLNFDFL